MSFRDNLQHLRAARDLSQAQLATLLGVSRQSVAKWEAEKSYPEMDKLIKLCDLFECSLDDLVRGDLTGCATAAEEPTVALKASTSVGGALIMPGTAEGESVLEAVGVEGEAPEGEVADACGYDEHMRRRAWDVAAGVAVIVMSFGVAMFVTGGGYNSTTVLANIVVHLVGIALGLCLFVPAYRSHAAFRKEHPVVEDCYTPEEKAEARRRKLFGVGGGVALLVLGMFMPGMLQSIQMFSFVPLGLFACFAAAIALLVHAVLMDRRVDVSFYNGAPDLTIRSLLRGRRTDA
ncbi:helix-turn-helix domain-containing protein [Eggerthella timonensis]|uniref:helix-turn-helix domain-containing protein n=1 Tax=Eggerthella timonensis TaxID=1871008 RepID=UPI000C767A19|nr:helix-turn-helix transcriptional regulator [Eggerthella timonensis]